ncbi:MAG: hypothetical protein AB2693_12470 [Candidatus Thiodiazotropha sp.]
MSNKGKGGKGGHKSPKEKDFQKSNASPQIGTAKLVEADEEDKFVVEAMQDLSSLKIKNDNDKIAYSVAKILIPFLGKTVRSSVESYSVQKPDFEKAKATIRVNKYENDRLEQYTRRENIRIHNLPVVEGKSLLSNVVDTLNDMFSYGAEEDPPFQVDEKDISTCHRVNRRQEASGDDDESGASRKQTIVRFVSRRVVANVYKFKKNLREMDKYKNRNVYITDDLTQLRLKLKSVVKDIEGVTKVFSKDGNIHCDKGGSHFVISSPDDLFNLGVDSINYEELGLPNLV